MGPGLGIQDALRAQATGSDEAGPYKAGIQVRLEAYPKVSSLLGAQISLRNNRRLQAAMRSGRLPAVKMLADFDFTFQPSIKREQLDSLQELGFLERRENVIFLGPPGVGKTHLAISLAIAAAQSGRRVYYGTLADLITSLEEAQAAGKLSQRLKTLTHPAILVVDEIGYLPITRNGAMLFYQLMTRRYETASTVLTSNKGFEEWGEIFGDDVMAPALIDRLLHHCHCRQHPRQQLPHEAPLRALEHAQLPDQLRGRDTQKSPEQKGGYRARWVTSDSPAGWDIFTCHKWDISLGVDTRARIQHGAALMGSSAKDVGLKQRKRGTTAYRELERRGVRGKALRVAANHVSR